MPQSLLFIPDISGYTNFIQQTEIEHAEHVISEILEVLLASNTQGMTLAEIEGDALFFYKEEANLSQEELLAQVEEMQVAFHSHLKMLEKNRICQCNACATAPDLQLKIVAHTGNIQFLKVQNNRKPFGNAVITVHRLLKNSVNDNNYVILSKELTENVKLKADYQNELYNFQLSSDEYDGVKVDYLYSHVGIDKLKLKSFPTPKELVFNREPNLSFEETYNCSLANLLETITNYSKRDKWVEGVDSFEFNEKEVTRLGSKHRCVIGNQQLDFVTVNKAAKEGEVVYGELTSSPPPVDELYQFFILKPIAENKCQLSFEVFWKARSPFKKLLISIVVKRVLKKNALKTLANLKNFVEKEAN